MRLLDRIAASVTTVFVSAAVLVAGLPAAPAQAAVTALPASVTSCSGVWVVVSRSATDVSVRCATKYATGIEALRSAGFVLDTSTSSYGEFINRINGFPEKLDSTYTNYWGYWHAAPKADGTWGAWQSYAEGASTTKPVKGQVEGWSYGPYTTTATFPTPPRGFAKKGAVKVTGTTKVGKKLTARVGTWSPKPSLSYQWFRGSKPIKKATKSTYKLTKADRGKKLHVTVTAHGAKLQTVQVTSSSTKKIRR